MGSFPDACEIVEAGEEVNSFQHSQRTYQPSPGSSVMDKGQKPPMLKLVHKESLEDDINKLFESISLRTSTKGWGLSHEVGTSMNPVQKGVLKKPISVPHSPRMGTSQPVSLKQALRELSITKASEMAAMKRLSMSTGSPGMSEASRIKCLYNAQVVEDSSGSGLLTDEWKRNTVSLVPEKSQPTSSQKMPLSLQVPKMKLLDQSANSSPHFAIPTLQIATGISHSANSSPRFAVTKMKNATGTGQSAHSSPRYAIPKMKIAEGTDRSPHYSLQFSVPTVQDATVTNQSARSPRFSSPTMQNSTGTNRGAHSSSQLAVPTVKSSTATNQSAHSSPRFSVPTQSDPQTTLMRDEIISTPANVGTHAVKAEIAQEEKHIPVHPSSITVDLPEQEKNVSAPTKLASRTSPVKSWRKGRLHAIPSPSSINGSRVTKISRYSPRVVKPVLRKKNAAKKKVKQDSTSAPSSSNSYIDVKTELEPSPTQLICHRCHCALKNASNLSNQDSPVALTSVRVEVISNIVSTGTSEPDFIPNDGDRSQDVAGIANSKGEFSQSSKSSLGDYSSSTSNSDDSNVSGSSCGNRPHMSTDVRWEAIRHVRMQYGALGLRHFNLLQKLGCGDIGTVYLTEIIGTTCLFAIKVMDNEFLARRKKMPRAQTEREILRMLDHPFLPTLYSQFSSDNLSCLVMEYCPGGDLHVLRQKQLGRCFSEPAARFYVAEVLLAMEYLHMLGVIYRDLKPENILVREDGHIMLTDFDLSLRCSVSPTLLKSASSNMDPARASGPCTESNCIQPFCIEPTCQVPCFSPMFLPATAKTRKSKADLAAQIRSLPQLVAEPTDARSNSFVGTHEYLAPEIIKGEGHGAAVDWWTFGIFLYELLYGRTPFKGSGNEETLANVVMQSLKFPDSPLVSFQARDLIGSLLVKEPENRLGSQKGAAEIKQHPFFEGLNWALIRCTIPPELPDMYDYAIQDMVPQKSKYLEREATGEQHEFEFF